MDEQGTGMGDRSDSYELDELLGAFALDAVDADERERIEDYLRINPKAAAEVEAHREVATMLAFTGMSAPADLWSKIAAEIDADAPTPGPELAKVFASASTPLPSPLATPPAPAPSAPLPVSDLGPRRDRRRGPTWVLSAAAAVVLAVAGAVVVISATDTSSNDPIAEAYGRALDDGDSLRAELVTDGSTDVALGVIDQDGHGYLDAAALPRLDADQTYQLWGVLEESGDVVSLGILGPDPELEPFTIEVGVAALAVTIEQAPGVISDGNPDGAFVGEFS